MKYTLAYLILTSLSFTQLFGQIHLGSQVKIGDDNSIISGDIALDISSDSLAFILPNLSLADMSNLTESLEGMMIYNTDTKKFQGYTVERGPATPVDCCSTNFLVIGPFNEDYGVVLTTPTAGKIESIVLKYFFNGSYNQPIRLVIADSPKNNCDVNNPTHILSLTDFFPATSGFNYYIPVNDIYLSAGQSIFIWPEQIDESIVKLIHRNPSNIDPNINKYDFLNCGQFSFDVQVKLNMTVITNEGWVDLH